MAKRSSIFLNLLDLAPKKVKAIVSSFDNLDEIFEVSYAGLRRIAHLTPKDIDAIIVSRKSAILDKELKLISKAKVDCFDIFDEVYPAILKQIDCPPLILYIKGSSNVLNKFLFAIVGSRTPTIYGAKMAEDFAFRLSSLGMVIVSGLAKGIDTAAHKGSLKKGETVAVLGSGLLNIYPRENLKFAESISKKGALISEFPLASGPLRENFPRRNRIVSGLSKGVLIVEAAQRSGALITARLAAEQNREVFAIPGNIGSLVSRGTHSLIKDGAKLVDSLEDILEELNIKYE